MASLKALAHPLRVHILESLSRFGPQTACSLGKILDESSGSTSYHLRQLAKHGFVQEIEGKGTARERWWQRSAGGFNVPSSKSFSNPEMIEATRLINNNVAAYRSELLADFMAHGDDVLNLEWAEVSSIGTSTLPMNATQMAKCVEKINEYSRMLIDQIKADGELEGQRAVQIHINAFPILDPQLDTFPAEEQAPSNTSLRSNHE
ncbi:ArsR/SmtB family transcription factor [Renibacterium salmoninarum]|nr:winged helix-turn-helix domain-containing protein [Renibacterium salmoninarum]